MILLVIFLGFVRINSVNGLICYYCTGSSPYDPCVVDNGSPSGCDKKYCTIFRQELRDPPGTLIQFYRSCQNTPQYVDNVVVTDDDFKTFYQSCSTDLCNSGDGRRKPNSIKPIDDEPGKVLIVPGIGSTASSTFSCYFNLLVVLALLQFLIAINL